VSYDHFPGSHPRFQGQGIPKKIPKPKKMLPTLIVVVFRAKVRRMRSSLTSGSRWEMMKMTPDPQILFFFVLCVFFWGIFSERKFEKNNDNEF